MSERKKKLNNPGTDEHMRDLKTTKRQQLSARAPQTHQTGDAQDPHAQLNLVEATTQPKLVKDIHDQTDVIRKPARTPRVGLIDLPEGPNPTSQSEPIRDQTNHRDGSDFYALLEASEEGLHDLASLLDLFDKPKFVPQKFCPSVGDVIIAANPKRSTLTLDNVDATSMEAKPLEFYPSSDPVELNGLVGMYQDSYYFLDDGEYRKSVSDVYEFQQGDIVVRLGHFNQHWHWCHASKFNCYLYYPKQLEGECCRGIAEVGPWFLLTKQETSQHGGLEPDPPPVPYPSITPIDLPPFSTLSYPFEFKAGDILMHHTDDKAFFKPWNWGLDVTVGNSKKRGQLEKILQPMDKILRYGFRVEHDPSNGTESTTAYVELFQYNGGSEWIFLGKNQNLYNHKATLPALIRFNVNTPQPGDIFINKSSYREWDVKEQTGGHVEIHRDASFFSVLEEPRDKLKNHIWGIGSDTTVVRFGAFASKEWNWMKKPTVDIFILNARGISLRRHCRIPWHNQWRPRANYNFSLHNPKNVCEVPAEFKPATGDVIIRYLRRNLVWDESILDEVGEPNVKIEFFDARHLARNELGNGDWLLRVGYEVSDQNRYWTHATAELYRYLVNPTTHCAFWNFMGRDTYVFGALPWPTRHGLFSGKELEQPYVDPDNDLLREDSSARKKGVDNSRAVRLFISGLGFQDMAYPLGVHGGMT